MQTVHQASRLPSSMRFCAEESWGEWAAVRVAPAKEQGEMKVTRQRADTEISRGHSRELQYSSL